MAITPAEIAETRGMVEEQNLDIRTITMGVSLMGCGDENLDRMCTKIYDHVTHTAEHLVETPRTSSASTVSPLSTSAFPSPRWRRSPRAARMRTSPPSRMPSTARRDARHRLPGRLLRTRPEGHRRRRPPRHPVHPPGARYHQPRLLQRQRRQPARRHQHGRRAHGGSDHHRCRQAYGR